MFYFRAPASTVFLPRGDRWTVKISYWKWRRVYLLGQPKVQDISRHTKRRSQQEKLDVRSIKPACFGSSDPTLKDTEIIRYCNQSTLGRLTKKIWRQNRLNCTYVPEDWHGTCRSRVSMWHFFWVQLRWSRATIQPPPDWSSSKYTSKFKKKKTAPAFKKNILTNLNFIETYFWINQHHPPWRTSGNTFDLVTWLVVEPPLWK